MNKKFAAICGISQQELEDNFIEELKVFDVDKIREWYNGYTWDLKTYLYNPFSLLNFFAGESFQNFWFSTGTPTFLTKLAKKERLYDVENIRCTPNQLEAYQLDNLCFEFKLDKSADEALEQIETKGYLEPYKNDGRRLFGIGVNFSTEQKAIEELLWREY